MPRLSLPLDRGIALADDAQKLLSWLLHYNLTWTMLSYGALFAPILALGNYFAQHRSIQQQAKIGTKAVDVRDLLD